VPGIDRLYSSGITPVKVPAASYAGSSTIYPASTHGSI
jgi:hypothetical protein